MKLFALLLLGTMCAAQTVTTTATGTGTLTTMSLITALRRHSGNDLHGNTKSAHNLLLEYAVRESCDDCNFTYAVYCETPGCATPKVVNNYFEWFGSEDEAIAFLEADQSIDFVGLYDIRGRVVSLKQTVEVKHEPQPEITSTVKHYAKP